MDANFNPFVFLFPLLVVSSLGLVSGEVRLKTYLTPDQCSRSEFFDVLSLSCTPCASFAEINFSIAPNQSEVLESTKADKTVCVCRSGLLLDQLGDKYRCVNHSCGTGQVYMLGECGICDETRPDCQCPTGSLLRKVYLQEETNNNESSVHFRCEPFQLSMGFGKAPCHLSYLLAPGQSCECPRDNFVEEDGQCVPQRALISSDTRLQYATIRFRFARFISQHLYRSMRPAVYNCNNLKNQSACHHLLNLCTLKLATELSSLESGEEKWNLCLYLNHLNPKLEFQVDSYYVSDHKKNLIQDQFHASDVIQIVATVFGSDGQFQGMANLRLNDLFLCNSAKLKRDQISFGTNLHKKCFWSATELWELAVRQKSSQFWELHLVSGTSKLYPMPVQVFFGEQAATRWMIKRFFLLNPQIGVDLVRFGQQGTSRFVLYARSVTLQFTISQHSVDGQIYPPVILVEYDAIDSGANGPNQSIETEFNVVFQMNDRNVKYNLNLVISILSFFAVLWAIFRTWCWMKRSASRLDLSVVGTFVAITISIVANILLLVSLIFFINQLVVFKFQSVIHTVLLTSEQEGIIIVYLVIAYIFKLIELCKKMISTTSIDIFFLDWEKPRKKELLECNGKMEFIGRERISNSDKRSDSGEQSSHRRPSGVSNLSNADSSANITIWRSYFIANEWCELNAKRRIDICVHIFVLIFFLECTDLKSFTRVMPNADASGVKGQWLEEVPESRTARVALASIFYILLASIQYLYKKYILENLGWGKLNQFIDLCSVSNISVFCLKYKRFGYYLHGLSPNGRSDVNMLEMYDFLMIEEQDLCSKRGLLPNTEQQTFEMYLPSVVHDHWKGLCKPFNRASPTPFLPRSSDLRNADKAKLVHTYFSVNRFLCSFIDHSFVKADYIVQDRSGFESLLNFELDSVHQKGRFYNDNGHAFENVLLYGIELTLATFELLTFLLIDLMSRNYILSAIGTYFISKLLTVTYVKMSRKNLVHKTLMDDRFLI